MSGPEAAYPEARAEQVYDRQESCDSGTSNGQGTQTRFTFSTGNLFTATDSRQGEVPGGGVTGTLPGKPELLSPEAQARNILHRSVRLSRCSSGSSPADAPWLRCLPPQSVQSSLRTVFTPSRMGTGLLSRKHVTQCNYFLARNLELKNSRNRHLNSISHPCAHQHVGGK